MADYRYKIVLIRHGESQWNLENRFTGWTDIDLTEKGAADAFAAGELLKKEGYVFDVAYTSVLRRAIRTLWNCLDAMDLLWIPVHKSWRLNERHYGSLQGLNKAEMAAKYGEDQVKQWRRAFNVQPPQMDWNDDRHPSKDPRYAGIEHAILPSGESLENTIGRVMPYWNETIIPALQEGKRIIIAAHGNSLRALVKHLDQMADDEVTELNIPVGVPLVYELNEDCLAVNHYYLGDQEKIQAQIQAVANQGKAK